MSLNQKLPAGKYYIGDPCYVIKDWDAFTDIWFSDPDPIFDFDGYDMACFHTKYGDGQYETDCGSLLPVDAGLIACVPAVLMTTGGYGDGMQVSFPEPFEVSMDFDSGKITFGDSWVMTGDETDCEDCPHCCGGR